MTVHTKFPSPYDLKTPAGRRGLGTALSLLSRLPGQSAGRRRTQILVLRLPALADRRSSRSTRSTVEFAVKCLGQYNTRHYLIPPANGIDYRIHNGYCYMSPVAVAPELIGARVPQFMERAGYYFQNWDRLLVNWDKKVRANIADLEALNFEKLPDVVPLDGSPRAAGSTTPMR